MSPDFSRIMDLEEQEKMDFFNETGEDEENFVITDKMVKKIINLPTGELIALKLKTDHDALWNIMEAELEARRMDESMGEVPEDTPCLDEPWWKHR